VHFSALVLCILCASMEHFIRHNLKCYCRCNISYTNKLTTEFVGLCSAFALNCSSSSDVTVSGNTKYAITLCGCDNSGYVSVLRIHLIMEVNWRLLRFCWNMNVCWCRSSRSTGRQTVGVL
jgi:hypothetical protein